MTSNSILKEHIYHKFITKKKVTRKENSFPRVYSIKAA